MSKRKANENAEYMQRKTDEEECLKRVYDALSIYFISKGIIAGVDNNTSIAFSGPIFNANGTPVFESNESVLAFGMPGFNWQMMMKNKLKTPIPIPISKGKATKDKKKINIQPAESFTSLVEQFAPFRINICSRSICSAPELCRSNSSSTKNFPGLSDRESSIESGKLACLFLLYALFSNNSLSPDNKESIKQMLICIDICNNPEYEQMTFFLSDGVYIDYEKPSLQFTLEGGAHKKRRKTTKKRRKPTKKRRKTRRRY